MNQIEKCCNMCGREIKESGLEREDYLLIEKQWGYFSDKDGEKHTIYMCESCYDLWIKSMQNSPIVEEITELLG